MSNNAEDTARIGALKQDEDSSSSATVTFDNLNNDCLVHILSFLETDEINDATFINSDFREARNADSLDQTRTATITIKTFYMSIDRLLDAIEDKGWTRFFSEESNYKCLKIVRVQGLYNHTSDRTIQDRLNQNPGGLLFQSVTSLDFISPASAGDEGRYVSSEATKAITHMLPNLQQVDLSYLITENVAICQITSYKPNLRCIKHNGAGNPVYFGPALLTPRFVGNLLEMQLDDATIVGSIGTPLDPRAILFSDLSETDSYLFMQCPRLQRVSMKNAAWQFDHGTDDIPVPQNVLIKLVRYHPTLRWLRSDLTDENIAMLKQERPEVTLVNK